MTTTDRDLLERAAKAACGEPAIRGRKPIKSIQVGDWVLGESLISSRVVGVPWKVTRIGGSRLYLERYALDRNGELEVADQRQMMAKTIRMAFYDFESANAVSQFARCRSDEYERHMNNEMKKLRTAVNDFADATTVAAPIVRAAAAMAGEGE